MTDRGVIEQPTVQPVLDVHRRAALTGLVRRHRHTFEWYDALLRETGVDETVPVSALPVMHEELLLAHYYTHDHPHLVDASSYLTSGTTTGRRKKILYAAEDHEEYVAHRRDLFAGFLEDLEPGATAVADLGTGHAAASARRIFSELGFVAHDIDFTRPIDEHLKLLNQWKPDVLFTMPMILDQLLCLDGALRITPKKIMVVGDIAPANWRAYVARRFGIAFADVLDVIGSIEVGAIAYYCNATGLYHFHDHIVPEAVPPARVDPSWDVELGPERGILLLTSFARRYFPAVRFATGDIVRGLRWFGFRGKTIAACERLEGRFGGDVKHGERMSNYDICAAVNDVFPGAPFEVVDAGHLELRIVVDEVTPEAAESIRAYLLARNPDVAQMARSGLVEEIGIRAIAADELSPGRAKRLFSLGAR